MSRIGKKPISLVEGVTVEVSKNNLVEVKGPKGSLQQQVDKDLTISVQDGIVNIERPTDQKRHKAMHGLYRSLIANMIEGVSQGFKKQLELVGVGYKASNQGNRLELSLGHSHNIVFLVPEEIKVTTDTQKGKNPLVVLEGVDKQLIGHVAAKLRSLRKVEPYKGKGVMFVGENIRRKAGKTAAK